VQLLLVVKRLVQEPLIHFLLLGGAIFVWFGIVAGPAPSLPQESRIVISSAMLERAALAWTQRAKRPPDAQELQGIVNEIVREEVLYREALALGLDRDDVVIRSLLRQKFEFVTQDLGFDAEPEEAVLRAFYAEHADRYSQAASLSFSQILFSEDKRGPAAEGDARRAFSDLQTATTPDAADVLGDGGALAPAYQDLADFEIEALFGPDFAAAIMGVEPGRWSEPIPSAYGLHLVWVDDRTSGSQQPFEEIKDQVRDDWVYEQRRLSNDSIYEKLLERYDVTIETPGASPDGTGGS
jgi:peptidyl-prolyl cis-trans isomerase C